MSVRKAVLRSFNAGNYTATLEISLSHQSYLEGVPVARNISQGEMTAGRQVAVVFFDEHNAKDAVVVAVYT